MIAGLKPYAEYKDSGLPWLGQVPVHWQIVRSKRLFAARKDLALPNDPQLSATQAYGVIEQAEFERRSGHRVVKISMHLDKRKHVEKDNFVISMRSFQGGIERAWASGAIRSSYVVLKPGPAVNASFFQYVLKSAGYIRALQATGDFIRDGQDLSFANFVRVDLPLLPMGEQVAIGRFLDWANGRLERGIRAKRKVIALLTEQKQAIIHRAITVGLDSTVPLQPSGLPWFGSFPTHWEVQRFKTKVGFQEGPGIMLSDFRETGVPLLRISCLAGVEATLNRCNYLSPAKVREKWSHFAVEPGNYLLSASGSTGAVRKASEEVVGAIPYTGIIRLWAKSAALDMEYLSLFMGAKPFAEQISAAKSGVGIEHFGPTHLKRMWICLPPIEEQRAIVAHIDISTFGLDKRIADLAHEIVLLREYRTRLVADVVTGKLDVRETASRLSDDSAQAIEAEPDDDPELTDEETEA